LIGDFGESVFDDFLLVVVAIDDFLLVVVAIDDFLLVVVAVDDFLLVVVAVDEFLLVVVAIDDFFLVVVAVDDFLLVLLVLGLEILLPRISRAKELWHNPSWHSCISPLKSISVEDGIVGSTPEDAREALAIRRAPTVAKNNENFILKLPRLCGSSGVKSTKVSH
jgi:hypothetical protein